ncbi:hypothetical protein ACFWYW_15495 [Nonomuraea sp. NPDC059023]|uniref:hypothetical protein n=1 Tax=unclassified Nonomuraea TaxID=2593643 RepID=UPI0036B20285
MMIALTWVTLGLLAANTVVAAYVIFFDRFPPWTPWLRRHRLNRISGWGNLLVSASIALNIIAAHTDYSYPITAAALLCLVGAAGLWYVGGTRSSSPAGGPPPYGR